MVTAGGFEQQIPPQAMVIRFGCPVISYDPTHHTGLGKAKVLAPKDFFITTPFERCPEVYKRLLSD
jgi:hypothetical protein